MPRRNDIQKLIRLYNRRLQKLREQEATKGINTSPEILIEIEDLEDKLVGLRAELETASDQPVSALSDDELTREVARLSGDPPAPSSSTQTGGINLSNISGGTFNVGGGIFTAGDVQGDVAGRDKVVENIGGDKVGRDKITGASPGAQPSPQEVLAAALAEWRQAVEATLEAQADLDEDDKESLQRTAAKVEAEAAKGEEVNPDKVSKWFNAMSAMAPDILEVTATTLQNPFAGVGLVLEKINDRIKVERSAQ